MSWFKKLRCEHDWNWHGWSYVKCTKCHKTEFNPELNSKLQAEFWERRIIEDHPMFSREAINKLLPRTHKI